MFALGGAQSSVAPEGIADSYNALHEGSSGREAAAAIAA